MINIRGDYGPITEWSDINKAFVKALGNERSYAMVVKAMEISTATTFGAFADEQAGQRPEELNHVYEWGQIGKPEGRLWNYLTSGPAGDKVMSYVFRASTQVVPVGPRVNPAIKGDTRHAVHIFHWKAAIGEEGMQVTIRPSSDKGILAFPVDQNWWGGSKLQTNMAFSKAPISVFIGQYTKGKFEELWEMFWESGTPNRIIAEEVTSPLELDLEKDLNAFYHSISPSNAYEVRSISNFTIGTRAKKSYASPVESAVIDGLNGRLRAARQRQALYDSESGIE